MGQQNSKFCVPTWGGGGGGGSGPVGQKPTFEFYFFEHFPGKQKKTFWWI